MTNVLTHGASGAQIASSLRDQILSGHYSPGEKVRQDELADEHGASRLPVREALRMLEAEGLVTIVANRGAWVSKLSARECEELYFMRERLEPLLLGLNVPLLSDEAIDGLELLADAMERSNDVDQFLRMDREFHLSAFASRETVALSDLVHALWNRTQHHRRVVTRLFYSDADRSVHYDHHLIVSALRNRDQEGAEHALAAHVRRSRMELAKHPGVFDG